MARPRSKIRNLTKKIAFAQNYNDIFHAWYRSYNSMISAREVVVMRKSLFTEEQSSGHSQALR
jgi:hypothetical protein